MPTTQVVRWFAGSLLVAGLGLGGCGGPPACRTGTLQVDLTFDSTAVQTEALTVTVRFPSGFITAQKSHLPGIQAQTIILDLGATPLTLPDIGAVDAGGSYAAGASYTLQIDAKLRGNTIAFGTLEGSLSANCTLQRLNIAAGVPPDLATPADLGVPPDQATPVDQSASDQSLPAGG